MSPKALHANTTEFIERHLDEELDLSIIAKEMNYSKFHFHRLFLSEMGLSVSDYLIRRRLIRSTYALATKDKSITEISVDIGFSNIDTFTRRFKKYFGITPSEYRKYCFGHKADNSKEYENVNEIMYDLPICSINEKRKVYDIVDRMIELSVEAHRNGLLYLESQLREYDGVFLKKAVTLLLEGIESPRLRKILYNYVRTTELSNTDKLYRIVIIEGILMIHKGDYPWNIERNLQSYFGEDFISEMNVTKLTKNRVKFYDKEVRFVKDNKLTNELKNMVHRSLQRLLRECDIILISLVSMAENKESRNKIINALPSGRRNNLVDAVELFGEADTNQIVDAQDEILQVIQKLRLSKDIK